MVCMALLGLKMYTASRLHTLHFAKWYLFHAFMGGRLLQDEQPAHCQGLLLVECDFSFGLNS